MFLSDSPRSMTRSLPEPPTTSRTLSGPRPAPKRSTNSRQSTDLGRPTSPMSVPIERSLSNGSSSSLRPLPRIDQDLGELSDSTPPPSIPNPFSRQSSTSSTTTASTASSSSSVRMTLVGAGVTGLAFAIHLATKIREMEECGQEIQKIRIHIYEGRIRKRESGKFTWLGPNDSPPNIRRQQVITLQDDVMALFDSDGVPLSDRIWKKQPGERAWPTSRQSAICVVEDRLLEWAQEDFLPEYITLHDQRMDNTLFNQIKDATDYLVIADGGGTNSFSTLPELGFHREELGEADTALGVYYERGIPNRADIPWLQAINVHLTLFNTIYLVNSFEARRGYLNVRLPPSYMEFLNQTKEGTLEALDNAENPIKDRIAQIIRAGLDMFDIPEDNVKAINYITLPMQWINPPVRAVEVGNKRLLAIVLGDAALKHHFWPGRGANSGLKGAVNLSWHFLHYLQDMKRRTNHLRPVDFSKYAAFMTELKLREHEGRGEYVQRLDIEACFREAYGPLSMNDLQSGRRISRASTQLRSGVRQRLASITTLPQSVQTALGRNLDVVLLKRLMDRRATLQRRPPFTSSTVLDENFTDALARLGKHDVTIKLLLCASGEWPTGEMASTQEITPADSLWPQAKEDMEISRARTTLRKMSTDKAQNTSGFNTLGEFLVSSNNVVVREVLDRLRSSSAGEKSECAAIVEAGLSKPIVDLLWHRDEALVERAAHVVHNLAGSDLSVKWALVQAQVLDKIRVVLSSSQNQTILIECCGTMGELALAMGQEEFFFEAGLTYALVGCLANQPDVVYKASLTAINRLVAQSERHKQAVVNAGILHRLRGVVLSSCPLVGEQVCMIIASLCATPELRAELQRSGVPKVLIRMLESEIPRDLMSAALLAIRVFAGHDEQEWNQFIDAGLYRRLLPLLTSSDLLIVFNACAVVTSVSDIPSLKSGAVRAFARPLVNLLWHDDPRVAEEAADALQLLALGSDSDKKEIIDAGILPKLALPLMTKHEDDKFCILACQLIMNLGPKFFKPRPIKKGFSGHLSQLASSTQAKPLKKAASLARDMVSSA